MFKVIPHTADIRLKVSAPTLEALFADALAGMAEIIKPDACIMAKELPIVRDLLVESVDETALLIDFLSEVLTLSHEQKAIFCRVDLAISGCSLKAKICGVRVNSFVEDIKAVTYHEAKVERNSKNNYETIIVFDI